MRIKGKLKILIASFLTVSSLLSIPVSAASATTVNYAYENYRNKNGIKKYKLADIDNNGIDDMMFRKGTALGVCSYNEKKQKVVRVAYLKDVKKAPYKIYYNQKKHLFAWCVSTKQGGTYSIYKLKGTSATKTKTLKWQNYLSGEIKYMMDGEKVKRSKFDTEVHKIWNYDYALLKNYFTKITKK